MNRFKIMIMSMNRFRLLLITMCAVAVTVFSSGIGVSYAEENSTAANPTAEKAAAEKRKADAATRALAKRAEMLKQRKDAKEYIKKVVEGQQPGEVTSPADAGTGGAK